MFDALDPDRHRAWIPKLLQAVEESASQEYSPSAFPFQVWLDVATRVGSEMPARWKTYRDLVVSDSAELEVLKEINADAAYHRFRSTTTESLAPSPPPPPPTFFLAYLDLRSMPTFTDGDVYKLRDPLSHFVAVLRLDGTGITDGGLAWIARAAKERSQYQRLEVLSLRGLRNVTDAGVAPLAVLSNLRLLGTSDQGLTSLRSGSLSRSRTDNWPLFADIRASGCTPALRKQINSALLTLPHAPAVTRTTYFRPPRELRADIDKDRVGETLVSPQIEVELFDPKNFSPALMIQLLHQLGSRPATALASASATSGFDKPVGVHITALTRTSASVRAGSGGPKPEPDPARPRTVEELYQAQLAIRSAQTHATHHTAYGGITSTVPISRVAVEESGRKEPGERGAPFRLRDDAVMGGGGSGWNDEPHESARAGTLYAAGLRRYHPLSSSGGGAWVPHERDPYSDDETEALAEEIYRAAEAEALAAQAREEEEGSLFYQYRHAGRGGVDRRIEKRGERTFGIPDKEEGMLLRFMPYVPPWEEDAGPATPIELELPTVGRNTVDSGKRKKAVVPPTPTLTKKRRRDDTTSDHTQISFGTFTSPTLSGGGSSSHPSRNRVHPAGSSSPSSAAFPFSSAPSSAKNTNKSIAKKAHPLYTPRSDPKNLVKTGSTLPKRSTLAAFRGKR